MQEYVDYLVSWLKESVENACVDGLIVGVSGGIDSAVVANLAKRAFPDNSLGVIMPCFSAESDTNDGLDLVKSCGIDYQIVDLSNVYDVMMKDALKSQVTHTLAQGNTKARLRMTTLYALAQNKNYLVVGTDNAAEWYTGYFTKHGDGGVDLVPLIHLTKGQVYEMAKLFNVPENIMTKKPTAGLITGQYISDEDELGIAYADIDKYLLGESIDGEIEKKLKKIHERSAHKREIAKGPQMKYVVK